MIEEVKELFHSLYMERVSKVMVIKGIFCDYFGEGRVDLQNVDSQEKMISLLENIKIGGIVQAYYVSDFYRRKGNSEDREIAESLIKEGALEEYALSDRILAKYFLPVIFEMQMVLIPVILIHFPKVRVTNEYGKYTDLKDLWVKVPVKYSGCGNASFSINRSSYTLAHLASNYMHSHISNIPFDNLEAFMPPCLGTGPIRSTLATLATVYDPSLWQLLCLEIDRYVSTESVSGTPYHMLENIGATGSLYHEFQLDTFTGANKAFVDNALYKFGVTWRGFLRYLLNSNKLKFNYRNGSYGLALSYQEAVLFISNEFISYYNSLPKDETRDISLGNNNVIQEVFAVNGGIMKKSSNSPNIDNYTRYIGKKVCTFKGKEITFSITNTNDFEENNSVRILALPLIEKLIFSILRIVNERYGKDGEEAAGASAQTRYI